MAIYNIGSTYYLGDIKYGNYNVNYPTISYLEGFPHNAISAEISALCTAAGLPFRNVLAQASFNTYSGSIMLAFGANGDIDDRYVFGTPDWTTLAAINYGQWCAMFDDSGYAGTNSVNTTNQILIQNQKDQTLGDGLGIATTDIGTLNSSVQWFGCANNRALALGNFQQRFSPTPSYVLNFWYAGQLDNVTTDFNYYSNSNITKSILIAGQYASWSATWQSVRGGHYISNAPKALLQSGFAEYPLSGSTTQWSGDLLVHDNNTTIGFPTIGEASLLRVLEGTYTIGKPAQLTGDVANRLWLPIGTWTTNRTLAVEVYSS